MDSKAWNFYAQTDVLSPSPEQTRSSNDKGF